MPLPARNTLAIIGAGPTGIEAALTALDQGFDVHVFERGEVGAHLIAWGHVRMFTPWRMNVGPATARALAASGWKAPEPDVCPTGLEYVQHCLEPAGQLPALAGRLHLHSQVVHVSRRGALKGDSGEGRREHPFRLLVRDAGGRENFLHAFSVIDASGVYGQPNRAGDGGIPARGEAYLAPQLSYELEDVRGARRTSYAGRRTLVIGAGASAATTVAALAELAAEAPGTSVVWATRRDANALYPERADDPLAERRTLGARARGLARGADPAVKHVTGVVEGFEFNSATQRYRVTLRADEHLMVEEVDQVIVHTGFGPDDSLYRELQIHECYASRGPMKLAAALRGANAADCLTAPAFGADALANPEPDFYVLGHKSYGRTSHFLLETGFRQVHDVIGELARAQQVAAPA